MHDKSKLSATQLMLFLNGLSMLFFACFVPIFWKQMQSPFGVAISHLIGCVQAIYLIALGLMHPYFLMPFPWVQLSYFFWMVSLWGNYLGCVLMGLWGTGRYLFIVKAHQNFIGTEIPQEGLRNTLTILLVAASIFVLPAIVISICSLVYAKFRSKGQMILKRISLLSSMSTLVYYTWSHFLH